MFAELFGHALEATIVYCDNQSCVKLSKNLAFRSKHIEIKYHYIHNVVQRGAVKLDYVAFGEQFANVLTKHLSRINFEYFSERLGLAENPFLREREHWLYCIMRMTIFLVLLVSLSLL